MDIKIKMRQDDMKRMTGREFFALQSGDMKTIYSVLSRCAYDQDNNKVAPDVAYESLLDLSLVELESIMAELQKAMLDGAIPPVNATSSNSQ